ncbi:Homoserine O-acetyltransferase [Terricaulis silvestris]|uniref:Probable acyltransferase n=1 Tax=Terricaulis silvestris TaxID=2686094 RepID=A0A6I6ML11_9CAUL|nr:homoserine O-acetyltransferase [Terricaulis silvestris]QGZ96055.1 Homoserine O-acetyltransferase [Terricaulis silvestris]
MIHAAAKIQAAGGVRTLAFDASAPLQLANGEHVAPLTVAFETYGALNTDRTNAVLVCHALTTDQFVASPNPITGRPAWWPRIVGPGRPIDTNRFIVICANVLGGSMGTTGPATLGPDHQPNGLRFPPITIADMVRAQSMLIEALGIESLFLVIGAGMGGMQALNWVSAYPKRAFACVTVAAAARQSATNIAISELGRQAVMADPDWRGGGYTAHGVRPSKGLAVARMAAQVASLSEQGVRSRIEDARQRERFKFDADVGTHGAIFVERFDANSYLYLSRAMDGFDLGADFGGRLANAFQGGSTRHAVFSFSSDWRFPPADGRTVARALIAAGADTSFVEIDSEKGHDAYLHEEPEFEATLTGFIDSAASARGLSLQGGGA